MARVQAGRGDLLQDSLAGGDHGTAAVVADGPRGRRLAAGLAVPHPCKTPLASPTATREVSQGPASPLRAPQPSHSMWHKDGDGHKLLEDTRGWQRMSLPGQLVPAPVSWDYSEEFMAGAAIPHSQREPHLGQQPHTHPHPLCFHWHSSHPSCRFLPWLLDIGLGTLHHQE